MQQLSYEPSDPWFEIDGWRLGVQVITFENVYGLDPEATRVTAEAGRTIVSCDGLTWAGGQQRSEGRVQIDAARTGDGLEVAVSARHPQTIRCVKLVLAGLPAGEAIGNFWQRSRLSTNGTILSYPFPLHTPLVFLAPADERHLYFRSLDDRVRAKRFALYER